MHADPFPLGPHLPSQPVAAEATSLGDLIRLRAQKTPDAMASFCKLNGQWHRLSWRETYDRARHVAKGLVDMGVGQGQTISIVGPTSIEWGCYDLGAQLLGITTVGLYPHQTPEQLRYILQHSESRVIFVGDAAELDTVLRATDNLDHVRAIVPWTEELTHQHWETDPRIISPLRFLGGPLSVEHVQARLDKIDPEQTAMLVYTSGTTGPPKGAMLSHANVLALLRSQQNFFEYYQDDLLISFLPMAHVAERNLGFYGRVNTGVAAAYASSMGALLTELPEVRPTIFGSVPRIFEKIHGRIWAEVDKKPAAVRSIFNWAVRIGRERTRRILEGRPVSRMLSLQYELAERLAFRKIRAALGGRVRACITGAAPTPLDVLEFFWSAGLPVYEVYGMTEATVVTHANRPGATRLGSVGRVVEPMECMLAEDGEILLKGPFVFRGYFKDDAATDEVLQEGWLCTGDVGQLDADGYLRITDRKKHLIITAGGKNIAPANVEQAMKSESPLISHVHVHGDNRPYLVALIAPSPLETLEWGVEHGVIAGDAFELRKAELLQNPAARGAALCAAMALVAGDERFQKLFLEPVRAGNRRLARVEQIRRFVLLDRDFSQEEGEVTPTLKLRRKSIEAKFKEVFDQIYSESGYALEPEPLERE